MMLGQCGAIRSGVAGARPHGVDAVKRELERRDGIQN